MQSDQELLNFPKTKDVNVLHNFVSYALNYSQNIQASSIYN